MAEVKCFIDTNILIYLLSADTTKANTAEEIVQTGGIISVQVLNEFTNVARKKLSMPWQEVHEVVGLLQSLCSVEALTITTHERGRLLAEKYSLSVYDAMIVAAALIADCEILYSEDMQHGQVFDERVRVVNPFVVKK